MYKRQQEGESIISIAPNCPIIMGRIDENPADARVETLTITSINLSSTSYDAGRKGSLELSDTYSNVNSAIPVGTFIYNSSGSLLGKIIAIETTSTSVCYILLDRPLPVSLSASEYLYTSTDKTHGLYLINTQGLRNGGIIQFAASELTARNQAGTVGSSAMPVMFNQHLTFSGSYVDGGHHCAIDRYGSFMWLSLIHI